MPLMILDTAGCLYISLFDKKYQVMISAQKPCINFYMYLLSNLNTGLIDKSSDVEIYVLNILDSPKFYHFVIKLIVISKGHESVATKMHAAVMLVSTSARLNRRTRFCRQGIIPRGTSITSSPSNSYHPTDHHHNEVLITSTRVSRECLQDSYVNGAGPPLNFPSVPRDPEPPNTTTWPGHSSPAISAILDDKRNGREKGQRPCS